MNFFLTLFQACLLGIMVSFFTACGQTGPLTPPTTTEESHRP